MTAVGRAVQSNHPGGGGREGAASLTCDKVSGQPGPVNFQRRARVVEQSSGIPTTLAGSLEQDGTLQPCMPWPLVSLDGHFDGLS